MRADDLFSHYVSNCLAVRLRRINDLERTRIVSQIYPSAYDGVIMYGFLPHTHTAGTVERGIENIDRYTMLCFEKTRTW